MHSCAVFVITVSRIQRKHDKDRLQKNILALFFCD